MTYLSHVISKLYRPSSARQVFALSRADAERLPLLPTAAVISITTPEKGPAERRRKVGLGLYELLGIQKGDAERMHKQHARNFQFFDAPVGLIFTVDTVMEQGSWLDYGMFIQNVMLAAKARGLDTCPQAAFVQFHRIIREEVGLPENETVVCGMSLGFGNPDAPENALRTERAPLTEWVQFKD